MPNTQTSVPAFTSGQVLTAQQQTEINTGIPVFATTTTRDAAFGGTGEKTLAEGQFAYIEASDTTQYYDGTAWQTLSVTPGLRYITGASFSAVSSFSLPDNTFTATYRNYRILVDITAISTTNVVTARLRASGSDNSTTNYSYGAIGWAQTALTITNQGSATTSWEASRQDSTAFAIGRTVWDVMSPQIAQKTTASGQTVYSAGSPVYWTMQNFSGIFNATTQFDAMSFIANTGTITGAYRVYGYSES